jgi:aspartate dehydrogenase
MLLPLAKNGRDSPIRVGVAGIGALGTYVCNRLLNGIPGLTLSATAARSAESRPKPVIDADIPNASLEGLAALADVIVECLSPEAFRDIAIPSLARGRILVVISSGALLLNPDILETHVRQAGQVVLPSGALPGLDGVRAACEGRNVSALLVTRKPPAALAGATAAPRHEASVGQGRAQRIFAGNALEAVRAFPRNANVAASVALAGVGAEKTAVEIWTDPHVKHNVHQLTIMSDSGTFQVNSRNAPSQDNRRSSLLAAQSIVATLRMLAAGWQQQLPRNAGVAIV